MDRLTSMHVFRNVVDCGSFSAAAKRLGMSNAAVTKHIQQLEGHLQVALLNRTTRKLALTDTGENYYAKCNMILDQVEETELAVKNINRSIAGLLRVNAPLDLLAGRTGPLLASFRQRFPDVSLDIHMSDALIDPIDGGFDITLRISGIEPDSSFTHEIVGSTDTIVVGSPEFLSGHRPIKTLHDIRSLPLLAYSHTNKPVFWELMSSENGEIITAKADGPIRSNSGHVLKDAAIEGAGLAMLPRFIVQSALADGRLMSISNVLKPRPMNIYALYASNRHVSEKIRGFIQFAKEEFNSGDEPWPVI